MGTFTLRTLPAADRLAGLGSNRTLRAQMTVAASCILIRGFEKHKLGCAHRLLHSALSTYHQTAGDRSNGLPPSLALSGSSANYTGL